MYQPWEDVCNANLVFRLDGVPGYIHNRPPVQHAWQTHSQRGTDAPMGQCLITGEQNAALARVHTPIKGVRGGQTYGGYIVSFNASAFVSYEQDKASVAESSAFAYTTALNALLTGNNRQKVVIGDTTYVFWASCNDDSEEYFADLFDPPAEASETAATRMTSRRRAIFAVCWRGYAITGRPLISYPIRKTTSSSTSSGWLPMPHGYRSASGRQTAWKQCWGVSAKYLCGNQHRPSVR